jgi:ABC-type nickel/cobalt efflux system permease component RcnA
LSSPTASRLHARTGLRPILPPFLALLAVGSTSWSHDIPNQRVDRSTQVTVHPGKLRIDYEVSLTELTLTQDLRSLISSLPGADRSEWLNRYGQVTGPLNAKGFLIHCDGLPVELNVQRFELVVEGHPRYTFHFEAPLPAAGRLGIHDTNYVSSEGTSRLAVRAQEGVRIEGDSMPEDVSQIPIKPTWQLGDEEERRTRKVEVTFQSPPKDEVGRGSSSRSDSSHGSSFGDVETGSSPRPNSDSTPQQDSDPGLRLSRLLDRGSGGSWLGLLVIAAGLGALHAVQPGHGKTLVSAIALGPGARWYQPALLGMVTTLAHTGSVLVIALILWWTGATQVAELHRSLRHFAGFAIAAGGFWRIGRALGQKPEIAESRVALSGALSLGALLGLGLAGGLVPCWDAVGLVILATALGRLGTGVMLVIAFGIGMAGVLVTVGLLASRLKSATSRYPITGVREAHFELASGLILAGIGLVLFLG